MNSYLMTEDLEYEAKVYQTGYLASLQIFFNEICIRIVCLATLALLPDLSIQYLKTNAIPNELPAGEEFCCDSGHLDQVQVRRRVLLGFSVELQAVPKSLVSKG